jgi:hypothetical protein
MDSGRELRRHGCRRLGKATSWSLAELRSDDSTTRRMKRGRDDAPADAPTRRAINERVRRLLCSDQASGRTL